MNTKFALPSRAVALTALFILHPSSFVLAQGSITPPGAPGPLFKTLDQVEPRRPISTYGTTISQPGSYYLTANLTSASASADAITIITNNVTLDLNGFALINTGGPGTSADGISFVGRENVTVRNGTIEGFNRGIIGTSTSSGCLIENLKISGCYSRGIAVVLSVDTPGGVIRNNVVYNIGGTTIGAADQEIRGIDAQGGSFVVEGNTVVGVTGKGASSGYSLYCANNTDTFVINNRCSRADVGIRMNGPNEYRDNLTSNCTTPYTAGTDRGNNF